MSGSSSSSSSSASSSISLGEALYIIHLGYKEEVKATVAYEEELNIATDYER